MVKLLAESIRESIISMTKDELLTDFFKPYFVKKYRLHLLTAEELKEAILKKQHL